MQGAGCLGLVHWDDLEGWCGGGEGLQNSAAGECSHEIERCLLLGREVMTNLDSILKMDFPVVMYGCESWAVK